MIEVLLSFCMFFLCVFMSLVLFSSILQFYFVCCCCFYIFMVCWLILCLIRIVCSFSVILYLCYIVVIVGIYDLIQPSFGYLFMIFVCGHFTGRFQPGAAFKGYNHVSSVLAETSVLFCLSRTIYKMCKQVLRSFYTGLVMY